MTMGMPKRRLGWGRTENSEVEGYHSEEATRDSTGEHRRRDSTLLEGLWSAPWDFMKVTMEQASHIVPHPSREKSGNPKRRDAVSNFTQIPSMMGNVLTDVTHSVGACVDACLPPILLPPRHLWLQYPKPHAAVTRNVDYTLDIDPVRQNDNSLMEKEHHVKESHSFPRASRPSLYTSLPPRLVNSFRIESMHERSEWNQSYFPILHLVWQLLQQWYHQMERLVRPMPLILWPLLLLLTFVFPMLPLVVVPLATLVYHHGAQLYANFAVPTPERVLEFVHWIYHIVTGWWTRFVGRARWNPDDDATQDIRTRKRTALAVSLATHAAGIGGTKSK
jgi:hypothetical protein